MSVQRLTKIAGNQLFLMLLILLTLFVYTASFLEHSSIIKELTSLYTSESDSSVISIMEILTGMEFHIITRFVSVFFTLYIFSFGLWLISKLDEIIFNVEKELKLKHFIKAYLYSLYVVVFDLLFQTVYMEMTGNEIPLAVLPYYMTFIFSCQLLIVLYLVGFKKHKLYITTSVSFLILFVLAGLLIYFGGNMI